ncbi:PREDICTED: interleukin-4 [Chrysochloris asiatica]|uniref:Interleukin-4 n=1 Tax=Chrysochloris asiatica TaxID=185453 RepID=A0A9B0TZ32_CHRAS|nr:PREDICTED: interleukin-4 [Chrysochloris asiatica]
MGLASRLIPTLLCLLVCSSTFIHSHKCGIVLKEIIKTLNFLTEKENACTQLTVPDAFAAPKNTTEKETFCRATVVLWQAYKQHKCLTQYLSGLYRGIRSMTNVTYCPVNENRTNTLSEFLEKLKTIMKEKYSKCGRRLF